MRRGWGPVGRSMSGSRDPMVWPNIGSIGASGERDERSRLGRTWPISTPVGNRVISWLSAGIGLSTVLLAGCAAPLLIEAAAAGGGLYGISRATQSDDKMRQATAAQLHVAMQDVSLTDVHRGSTTDSWTAAARGASYTCSSTKEILNTTCSAWRRNEVPAARPQAVAAQATPAAAMAVLPAKADAPTSPPKKHKRHHHASPPSQ